MTSSTSLNGIGFHVETSRALRRDTARYVKRIEAAGGTAYRDPMDPRVSIIIVFPPDRHATNLVVPVGSRKKNALALTMLDDWTYLDLISHFARSSDGADGAQGHAAESSERGRHKYTKVFCAGWLAPVVKLEGSIQGLWESEGALPFPHYEVWADIHNAPPQADSVAGPSRSTGAAEDGPSSQTRSFLLSLPPHTPAAWLAHAGGESVARKRRRASISAREENKRAMPARTPEEESPAELTSSSQARDSPPAANDPSESSERESRSSSPARQEDDPDDPEDP